MTNEELVVLIQQGIDVQENMGKLYEQNKKIIYKIVSQYSKVMEIEDLMQEAYFALYKSALQYDTKSEFKFMSYAGKAIKFNIMRYINNNGNMKRVPESIMMLILKYHKFVREYENQNNEKPNDKEIIQYLGINEKQLKFLRKTILESFIINIQEKHPKTDNCTYEDTIADKFNLEEDICDKLLHEQLKEDLWNEVETLDKKQKEIIKLRYKEGLDGTVIAKNKNMTHQNIYQIEKNALKILKQKEKVQNMAKEFYYNTSRPYYGNYSSFKYNGSMVENIVIKKIEVEDKVFNEIKQMEDKRSKLLASLNI